MVRYRLIVRARTEADVPALCEVLAAQQPGSRYPLCGPLPFPVEEFIARDSEEQAWAAEVDERAVGHVAIVGIVERDDGIARCGIEAAGTGIDGLACVSVLFVGRDLQGHGIGGVLLDTAVAWARERGRVPVLDVVQRDGAAVDVYRHRGWREVGQARPAWLPDTEPPVLLMILPPDHGTAAPGDDERLGASELRRGSRDVRSGPGWPRDLS